MPVRPNTTLTKPKPKNGSTLHKEFMEAIQSGPANTVQVRATRVLDKHFNGKNLIPAQKGDLRNPKGTPRGRTLFKQVQMILQERCEVELVNGKRIASDRLYKAALAFVKKMEDGEFPFHKEFLDREEGKVPTRVAGHDGGPIKMYAAVAVDGPNAP
jgi:hypothetical protein